MTTMPVSSASQPQITSMMGLELPVDEKVVNYEETQKLIKWTKDAYARAKSDRTKDQLQWYMNLAFYKGDQYLEYFHAGNRLVRPKAPPYRVRHISNRIRPLIRTELARVTSQKPNATVVPASSEDEDLFAAQAAEQIWESIYFRKKIHDTFREAAWWMLITGVGFIKTYWDNNLPDGEGKPGDLCYEAITPFHLYVPNLREPSLQGQPYILNVYTRPVEWVKRFWGDKLQEPDKIKAEVVSANEIMEGAYLKIQSDTTQPDSVLVTEVWLKPGAHERFPNGGMFTMVGNEIVQLFDEFPYQHDEYPFAKLEHIPSGKFYADSTIVDVIPLQREYNRTRSQIIEAKNRMAKPQLIAPEGSINPSKITTEPGQVILYRQGFTPPQPLALQPLPAYVLNELQTTLVDIEDISGQHQVSKGSAPPGVTAATAISFLQERDDSLMSHTYASVETATETVARQSLQLVTQFWDFPRLVKTVGTDGAFNALQLSGADIKNGTDIRVEGGSALPVSKAAKQAFVMDMMKMQFIPPQEGLKLLEMGGIQSLYDQLQVDQRQAQRENLKLRQLTPEQIEQHEMLWMQATQMQDPSASTPEGEPTAPPPVVTVNTFDNHQVHIEVHDRFRKSAAFEMLTDEVKAQFEMHVQAHKMAMMGGMQDDILSQMASMAEPLGEEGMGEEMPMPGQAPGPMPGEGGNQFSGMEGMGGELSG